MPTREELLDRMGINDPDLREYLRKHVAFVKSLNSSQRKFHEKNTVRRDLLKRSRSPLVRTSRRSTSRVCLKRRPLSKAWQV